jgi:hypothetical protein
MGKLSDQDYASIKVDLQQQLAVVLGEIEKVQAGAKPAPAAEAPPPAPAEPANVCPRCSARFSQPMKFCGECGQAMPAAS